MKLFYMKSLIRTCILFSLCFFSFTGYATVNAGSIALDAYNTTQLEFCPQSSVPVYNHQAANGGSGSFIYKWETKTRWNGVWHSFQASAWDSVSLFHSGVHCVYGEFIYYRRIAVDRNNLSDSAISNEVIISSYIAESGSILLSTGYYDADVPVGTTPPYINNDQIGNILYNPDPPSYLWEYRLDTDTIWHSINNIPTYYYSYQPPAQNTPQKIWYRRSVYDNCGFNYPDGTTLEQITINFYIPITFDPGTISADTNNICPGTTVHLTSTLTTAPIPFTYKWEYSADSVNWSARAYTDSFSDNNVTATRYYRRSVTSHYSTYYSNVVKVSLVSLVNPSTYGSNQWNMYGYNGKNLSTSGISYQGYYTTSVLNINTLHDWADSLSPSAAAGYIGCPVSNDNFTIAARRIGFDSGSYQLQVPLNNDAVQIKVNGTLLYSGGCCNINPANVMIGKLGPNSKIEIAQVTGTAHAALQVNFIKIDTAQTSSYTDSACHTYNVRNAASNQFIPLVDSAGQVVAAVNPNNVYLGTLSVSMKHSMHGAANIPTGNFGVPDMPRYFNFTAGSYINTPFPNPVTVRLYYLNSEFDDYKIATSQPFLTINDLRVSHYDGVNQDCDVNNNSALGDTLIPIATGPFGADAFYLDVMATRFSEFGVNGSLNTLPVKWLTATAIAKKSDVLIQWKVAEELNNNSFEILRSMDGISFSVIASVPGKGNSQVPSAYSFTDKVSPTGNRFIYYRIKQIDKDQRFSFSQVMKINLSSNEQMVLLPNPAKDYATLRSSRIISNISIADVSGRVLYRANVSATEIVINVSAFSKGIYIVKAVMEAGEDKVIKMVKE